MLIMSNILRTLKGANMENERILTGEEYAKIETLVNGAIMASNKKRSKYIYKTLRVYEKHVKNRRK